MRFVRKSANTIPINDTVFAVAAAAKKDRAENGDLVTDATIGSLYDEEGNFTALKSVFDHYDAIDHRTKGAYAASFSGNPDFCRDVYEWVTQGTGLSLAHAVVATPGGSGAVSTAFSSFLDEGDTVLIPDIGWSSYQLMAVHFNRKFRFYSMFDGDHFNLASIRSKIAELKETQDRIVLVINDPCHNPTGYSLTGREWEELIDLLNEAAEDRPVILINDIAYLDYSFDLSHCRDYMKTFEKISRNVMIVSAFSCSKALTSYGLRCGAAILLGKEERDVQEAAVVVEKTARAIWSNIPNAAMHNFCWVVTQNREAYLTEKQYYIDLLKQRSEVFLKEAKECGLKLYPYREGFFVTIVCDSDRVEAVHSALMKEHIYTVCVDGGIRVALCSLPVAKTYGLAGRIEAVMKQTVPGED